ncbi:ankyrin [Terfezia boudieri ATCC MYA-4762]|uniref:Ankyrin n=1 Tax=Terfezia boudieri ATCC MYA-4762 TaxID=1051890 RepID=A0A3N4LC79_9PEZI|nr:ankyrin [Terfezia boudieri ATCC MYA-4762]
MSQNFGNALVAAAQNGDLISIKTLLEKGASVEDRSSRLTPLMAAVMAGNMEVVNFLLSAKADINARDDDSRTIIKLALDNNQRAIAEALVKRFHDQLIVTDPRLREGEEWLRREFRSMSDNVKDPASRPDPAVLERIIAGKLGPTENRSVSDVYWEHILLRYVGDIPLDIERNYSKNLVLSLVGTFERILKGHEGIKESARLLNSRLPTTKYDIVGTVVDKTGGWVTERWGYHDVKNNLQVVDGIDSFLIQGGKITVKMINYTVQNYADSREEYRKKLGL